MGERESLARDSVMRMMASSWRTVMGMEERVEAAISEAWIWRRMETKWEESFSPASGERRGAQRLGRGFVSRGDLGGEEGGREKRSLRRVLTICNS